MILKAEFVNFNWLSGIWYGLIGKELPLLKVECWENGAIAAMPSWIWNSVFGPSNTLILQKSGEL